MTAAQKATPSSHMLGEVADRDVLAAGDAVQVGVEQPDRAHAEPAHRADGGLGLLVVGQLRRLLVVQARTLHGQALDAVEEVRAQARRRACELDAVEVRDHLLEPDLDLELGQVRAEAEVRPAEAEGEVAVRLPADVEAVGVGELLLVEVARRVPHRHLIARLDSAAVHRRRRASRCAGSGARGAPGAGSRRPPCAASDGSATSRSRSSGCGEQVDQAEADRVPRRLVAGRREEDEEDPELALGQPRAVDLGLDEPWS